MTDSQYYRGRARRATGRGRLFAGAETASTMADVERRGKIVALSTGAVGVVVMVAAGIAAVVAARLRQEKQG